MLARVRLFKRGTRKEDLLRGHLERLGVSPAWLPSARDAIRYCEEGDYFQPVFSVAGPAPARSVVALMRLQPFVEGEIDWSISPSESPFWVGSLGDPHDELFSETANRFTDLFLVDERFRDRSDLDAALQFMVDAVAQSLAGETRELDAETRRGIWSLGSGGYLWRVAESAAQTTDLNLRADLAKEVEAVIDSFPEEKGPRARVLAWAAAECVHRDLLLGSGCPGGWARGGEFLRRGFRFVDRQVVPGEVVLPREDKWYAFSYGVALYDVDECLTRRPAPRPRPSSKQRTKTRV
jgi:hypothetical protein